MYSPTDHDQLFLLICRFNYMNRRTIVPRAIKHRSDELIIFPIFQPCPARYCCSTAWIPNLAKEMLNKADKLNFSFKGCFSRPAGNV
ncbi:hypothetical protein CW304_08020 [Bacillus sp. UFRGS-B20]|nr:hypothetical protein CW304_08020 [Bacillus sp. UFRGS-B20]